ncbi:MAG: hypothetical protein QM802_06825 [Agriterribacter sp.]
MKRITAFAFVCIICFGCKKNKLSDTPLLEHYPQEWIFTVDYTPGEYLYFYTKPNNMYTDRIETSYPLSALAEDVDCKFYLNLTRGSDGKQHITLQVSNDKHRWVFANVSTNGQEKHMGISYKESETALDNDELNYMFDIHKIEHSSGVKTVAIESVAYPGYYVSSAPPGFNYNANQLTLEQANSPENATEWQCR